MPNDEYKKYLEFLFEEYVKNRLSLGRRYIHKMRFEKYGFEGEQRRLQKAVFLCRYIHSFCDDDDEILRTFTLPALQDHVGTIMDAYRDNNRLLDKLGIIDCLESHYEKIVSGIEYELLPSYDTEIMKQLGSKTPENDLRAIIYSIKNEKTEKQSTNDSYKQSSTEKRLKRIESMIEDGWRGYYDAREGRAEKPPKKSRRWFKGLGNIGQGVALSIGNIGLALGAFNFPVSPETQTWGAIVSVTTGVGMAMNGIGELRSE
ncbi:hypothetical protein [Candidatus Thiosymbion oneisti]|uniref:hypothetical protein n=1 Tax=Candidatus Thiosymbion oneisti TaxID=589554 RepID=UPI00114C9F59|nr:hypothetical protein [Candidatus Thiosymbion oneisti]